MNKIRSGAPYSIPENFKLEDHVQGNFGMFLEDREYEVRIQFDRIMAPFISERTWGKNQKITPGKNGSIELAFSAASLVELSSWVLSYGSHATVLGPKELVARIKKEINGMSALYATL